MFRPQQEAAFRKVVQATMVRDRQHGPVVELNRIQVQTGTYEHGSSFNFTFTHNPVHLSVSFCL